MLFFYSAAINKRTSSAKLSNGSETKRFSCSISSLRRKKGKSPSVTLIPHAFSKKIKYTLLCVFLYLQILAAKITSLHCILPVLFGSIRALSAMERYNESLKKNIQKIPYSSLKKTSLSTIANLFTPAYDSTPKILAAEIHQKRPLLDQE